MKLAAVALAATLAAALPAAPPDVPDWRPPDLRPSTATTAAVLAAYAAAAGTPNPAYAQRREQWTYVSGERRVPVRVAVRGDDFRAVVELGAAQYAAGRTGGTRWRADANGIAHATLSDDQGDAVDRLPVSVFPFATADCALAGESTRFGDAWVVVLRAPHDKPHWLYVDKATGRVTHEVVREGARTLVTAFANFEPLAGVTRPRRWRVADGDPAGDLDVTVDAVDAEPVATADVSPPRVRRVFAAASERGERVPLPVRFRGRTIFVDVDLDGEPRRFVLDTGSTAILLDAGIAERRGWSPFLEHATVPYIAAGALRLDRASTLAIPLARAGVSGILGFDFFAGHVVHVDYARRRVDVLTGAAADAPFHDPRIAVLSARFEEGIPLVRASFGDASGDRFALDTGSPHLVVGAPFERAHAHAIATWTRTAFDDGSPMRRFAYLEGSVWALARRAPEFSAGPARFAGLTVAVQAPNPEPRGIDLALDGIVGTDEMTGYEWWFDADRDRIGMRRNASD